MSKTGRVLRIEKTSIHDGEVLMQVDREFAGDIHISIPEIRHSQKRTACVMICSDDNKEELI